MTDKEPKPVSAATGWSKDVLLAKAQRYAEQMLSQPRDDWKFGLWSTFVLEFLARAALANVSSVLLADLRDWNDVYYALGQQPKVNKFIPRSLDIGAVLNRLREIFPEFDSGLEGFALRHMSARNEELHSGDTPFNGAEWLAPYYRTCKTLLRTMGEDLKLLFGNEEAAFAEKLMLADQDETAKSIGKTIHAHKTVFEKKDLAERQQLADQASVWATRQHGHRVKCPACGSAALLTGEPATPPIRTLKDDEIIETQSYLPSKFECIACGLKIAGLAQLAAAGLGNTYNARFTYDAAEYYAPEPELLEPEYEPDFND